MKSRINTSISLVLAAGLIAGCSSSSGDSDKDKAPNDKQTSGELSAGDNPAGGSNDDAVTAWGTISIELEPDESPVTVSLDAGFFTFSGDRLPRLPRLLQLRASAEDSCEVTAGALESVFEIQDEFGSDLQTSSVSAGETITFSSPAGTYAELTRGSIRGYTYYEDTVFARLPPVPNGLTVTVPGDVFPMFDNVAVPEADPLVLSSPESVDEFLVASLTQNATLTWESSANPDTRILINSYSYDYARGEIINLDCSLMDDGSFVLPESIRAELVGRNFIPFEVDAVRSAFIFERRGDAVLFIVNET